MTPFEQLQKNINQGWQTWNNASVFSYVHMPEKMGFKLGLKDYKYEKSLPAALIGSEPADGIVTPYAHAYDNSYTFSRLEWLDIEITVETACTDGDQVVIVTPVKLPPQGAHSDRGKHKPLEQQRHSHQKRQYTHSAEG